MAANANYGVGSVLLYYMSNEPDTVSWSEDERIAVTANEIVYILTLKGPGGHGISPDPSTSKDRPLYVISQAQPPTKDRMVPLDLGGVDRYGPSEFPPHGKWDMTSLLDPFLVGANSSCDSFKKSDWTPVGCSALRGCILTCMTLSGRLMLYSPPATISNRWRLTADLTSIYCDMLKSCQFDHTYLPQQVQPCTQTTPTSPSPKAGIKTKIDINTEYNRRRFSVACTSFDWLPTLLESGTGIVAMTTRSGHVILLGMHMPIGLVVKEEVSVLYVSELSLENESWPCKLKWHCKSSRGVSLAVGCTEGQVFCLQWRDIEQLPRETPVISELWKEKDNIPVYNLGWKRCVSASPVELEWLVFSKGAVLVALSVNDHTPDTPTHKVIISGHHVVPVIALCCLSNGSFLSTAHDGSMQTFALPDHQKSHDDHVTPTPVAMETLLTAEGGIVSTQGVAVSHNGVFVVLATNLRQDHIRYRKKHLSQLHFVSLPSSGEVEAIIKKHDVCQWDVCEYFQQVYLDQKQLPTSMERMISPKTKSPSLSKLQLSLQLSVISEKGPDAITKCKENVVRRHIVNSLRHWQIWRESHKEEVDTLSSLCLHLMCQWLISKGGSPSSDITQTKKVRGALPPNQSEVCVACGEEMTISDCERETCQNGHVWNRCSLTLMLATDFQNHVCLQCSSTRAHFECAEGTWLESFLIEHTRCIYCGGYFEQVT